MKVIENIKSVTENYTLLGSLIDVFLDQLKEHKLKNRQKILEVCHVGKFLMFFNNKIQIDQLFEQPDFILVNESRVKIGLEHQLIIDPKSKEREGFFENIFSKAELEIQSEKDMPNFLANCYIKPYTNFKLQEKKKLVEIIKAVIKEYVLNENFIENPIIDRISKMPHSHKNITANLGGWWYKNVNSELILNGIKKKEKKINEYRKNSVDEQWLLLVLGTTGESSFEMDKSLNLNPKTDFNKVYILEDFNNKLYEIK